MLSSKNLWLLAASLAFIFTCLVGSLAWLQHQPAAPGMRQAAILNKGLFLSELAQQKLVKYVDQEDLIIAGSAVNVDLIKNQRRTTFMYSQSIAFKAVWEGYLLQRAPAPAAFASTAEQNSRLASIINGNFVCQPFQDSINAQLLPAAADLVNTICSISVPAGFDGSGDFVGFLNFFLSRPPGDLEKKRLAKSAIELSTAIYRLDQSR